MLSASMRSADKMRFAHALLTLTTAIVNVSPYHPDEHFQIIEYAGFKLGLLPRELLTWEFSEHMRPWLFPGAVYLLLRGLSALHIGDLFAQLTIVRVVCAAFAWWSLDALIRRTKSWLPVSLQPSQEAALRLVGFLPWLFARPCSETVASTFFVFAFVHFTAPPRGAEQRRSWGRLFAVGVLGLAAFEVRYQTGILLASLVAWGYAIDRRSWRELIPIVLGSAVMLLAATAVDAWGYGVIVFAPLRYFHVNLVQGAASRFSTSPPWFYLPATISNVFAPSALLALLAMLVLALRQPKHVLTWVTMPFFLIHSFLLAHKEDRFLWPIAIFAAAAIVPAFAPGPVDSPFAAFFAKLWPLRTTRTFRTLVVLNVASALFVALVPVNGAEHGELAREVYRAVPPGAPIYMQDADITEYNMYRREWKPRRLAPACCPFEGTSPAYVLTTHTGPPLADSATASVLYTEWPLGSYEAFFGRLARAFPAFHAPSLHTLYRVTPKAACETRLPVCATAERPPAYVQSPLSSHKP